MKQKILIILVFVFFPYLVFSQITVNISSNKIPIYPQNADTISVCRDTIIIFEASADISGTPVTNANYFWDFDDGFQINGTDLDSVSHIYSSGGGYRVSLYVTDLSANSGYDIFPVKIDFPADFRYTDTDISQEQSGICKGSSAGLLGKVFPSIWKKEFNSKISETSPVIFHDTKTYTSSINFNQFPVNSTFTDGNIDSVAVLLEHSDMGNVKIELVCPDGKSAVLKDYIATNHAYLGNPIDEETLLLPGTAYFYYFSQSASAGIINDEIAATIPSQAYQPEQNFSTLNGCPLNGTWQIQISDNLPDDNGFIFEWKIIFNSAVEPQTWTFTDTLKKNYIYPDGSIAGTYWSGKNVGGTSIILNNDTLTAISIAAPEIYGNNAYTLFTVNDWGCPKDTSITLRVEPVSFTATPESGEAKLNVSFANTTSWGNSFIWNFGDETETETDENTTHEYAGKGTYYAVLKVFDRNLCFDTDTITIEVAVEPSKLAEIPNTFTPNGDGLNDFLKFDVSGMYQFQFIIYNRWGEKLFESDNQEFMKDTGWDGKTKLTKLTISPGTYYYYVKAIGLDLKLYEEKGTVHVFR